MITTKDVLLHYQYFFRKRYNSKTYRFLLSDAKKIQLVSTFIEMMEAQYGDNAGELQLWTYFLFQFQRWDGVVFKDKGTINGDRILPSMILGQKAFAKFVTRDQTFDWQLHSFSAFAEKYKIRRTEIYPQVQEEKTVSKPVTIKVHRDPNKAAFLNTQDGLVTCVELTALYDERDVSCRKCNFKDECLQMLKTHYPNIYKQHGQREGKTK